MAAATLTALNPTASFATTPGTTYAVGLTGNFGGSKVLPESANAATPAVFSPVSAPVAETPHGNYVATGAYLRLTALNPTAATSINVEVT